MQMLVNIRSQASVFFSILFQVYIDKFIDKKPVFSRISEIHQHFNLTKSYKTY